MKPRALLLLSLCGLAACGGGPAPYASTVGLLHPHETITVRIARGTLNAYAPAAGEPADRFTISAYADSAGTQPAAPTIEAVRGGIDVDAPALRSLLVRVPQGVDLRVISGGGDVNVTDISANAYVAATTGNVTLMLPGYAEASLSGGGSIAVTMGATQWPGVLRFFNGLHGLRRARYVERQEREHRRAGQRRRRARRRGRHAQGRDQTPASRASDVNYAVSPRSASFALIKRTIASLYGVGTPARRPNATTAPLM